MKKLLAALPGPLRRYVLDFETRIEDAVSGFAGSLPKPARILDAGAGEGQYRSHFAGHRYTGADLGIGDAAWNYGSLDVIADLASLPFPPQTFDAAINIVTLEHVADPALVLAELRRVLRPGARLLLVVPHEWEVHQHPHDYFRFTRFGVELLAKSAGFTVRSIQPGGGYFRLLARRLLGGARFFPLPLAFIWLWLTAPTALLLPLLDGLDKDKDFTLGYIAILESTGE